MPEFEKPTNLNKKTANDLATEVIQVISAEAIEKKAEMRIGRIQQIINEVFEKNNINPTENKETMDLHFAVHNLVMPKNMRLVKEEPVSENKKPETKNEKQTPKKVPKEKPPIISESQAIKDWQDRMGQ